MEYKPFWLSKTIWGAVSSTLALVILLVVSHRIEDRYFALMGIFSNIGVIWGRITAKHKLTKGGTKNGSNR